jgi:hypothetical protein
LYSLHNFSFILPKVNKFRIIKKIHSLDDLHWPERFQINDIRKSLYEYTNAMSGFDRSGIFKHLFTSLELATNSDGDEKNGVRIREGSYQYFKRYDDNHTQLEPATSDNDISKGRRLFDNLISSFNISKDNAEGDKQLLLKAYWISLYFNTDPKFPMPIPTVAGPHDSAKSTLLGTINGGNEMITEGEA